MKRFRFSLEKVLELRKYRERETKLELGRAVGGLQAVEGRIRENAADRREAAASRFSSGGAMEMIHHENYIRRLDQQREALLRDAAAAELAVEEKREQYLAASRDRKVVDKLREKREAEHRKERAAEERAELDDIAGGRPLYDPGETRYIMEHAARQGRRNDQ
ncbi:MAG: flagellar export protein FliJ [Treponema sp.]|nr:flagellar export protein FliJ [Treponema sp.]